MSDKFGFGDSWRVTFRRSMWVSFIVFEIVTIILSSWLSDIAVNLDLMKSDESFVIVIIGIIAGTVLNEAVHSLWACTAYMFEDIARTRKVNEQIMELLEQQNNQQSYEKSGIKDDAPVGTLSLHKDTPSPAKRTSSSNASIERMRLISERTAENQSREHQKLWVCPECGTANPTTSSFCKDCGHYK
ncbi:MAG: hypothetical protein ACI4KM_11875 [Oscillospiraceae bacterium]